MNNHATAESNMIRMARLRERLVQAEAEKTRAGIALKEVENELKALRESVNAEFLRRHDAGEMLPKGVSVRTVCKLDYDADAVLADAIAEGIDTVVSWGKPRLRKREFETMVKSVDGAFPCVTRLEVPTVFISEVARLHAWIQGVEAEKRNIDIDTGEIRNGAS